ncbi:MAG: hypothetical protein A3G45_00300 [Candidatus Staskawiczbacteria bacterium RIFCSPLOWO2_12_FULL_37_15]|uniref:Uncharacterized protein n=1 Tax=Candidatus Staskawiczbacteria bacterium RIFCSPLOWO2_12_FULL_37_15 TaxID=1802218 RepID=A0A1G2IQS6_9BACT|nr:MAG: hypothetical protein A3G45_00300 [Candidatus Staskawiczbacteria bacterium RIFCSPLOWO2_12_FULL_37_15]HXK41025.1 hypothetical protein [Candidatus Paceibacterota bacterium]
MLKRVLYQVAKAIIEFKWFLLGDYYSRLAVQARYLYRQSSLFKDRWQHIGLDYAENSFEDVADHFFRKAKKEHILNSRPDISGLNFRKTAAAICNKGR